MMDKGSIREFELEQSNWIYILSSVVEPIKSERIYSNNI